MQINNCITPVPISAKEYLQTESNWLQLQFHHYQEKMSLPEAVQVSRAQVMLQLTIIMVIHNQYNIPNEVYQNVPVNISFLWDLIKIIYKQRFMTATLHGSQGLYTNTDISPPVNYCTMYPVQVSAVQLWSYQCNHCNNYMGILHACSIKYIVILHTCADTHEQQAHIHTNRQTCIHIHTDRLR